ncbi:MAG: GNAT family N-acetyltransferase [Sphingobacteriia bacterium]|nr:MAG: GNAT family N-acetyltransferase [Sphingobacteriia bacterium]TAH08665.1 MAG: GNAT family N-acetyltransferase [Sphingobacteriia bacterium]
MENTFHKILAAHTLNDEQITVQVISDNHPDMVLATKLWYEVYIQELEYPFYKGVCLKAETLDCNRDGSLVFMLLCNGKCIATLRATHSDFTSLEFKYRDYSDKERLFEITRLVTRKDYRQGRYTKLIIYHAETYLKHHFEYEGIVMNAIEKLVGYYQRIGFKKISNDAIQHPILGKKICLMYSSFKDFENVVNKMGNTLSIHA